MPEKKSLDWLKVSKTPPGSDFVLELMKQKGVPLTGENYLAIAAYPDEPDGNPELEANMPSELREILEQTTQSVSD